MSRSLGTQLISGSYGIVWMERRDIPKRATVRNQLSTENVVRRLPIDAHSPAHQISRISEDTLLSLGKSASRSPSDEKRVKHFVLRPAQPATEYAKLLTMSTVPLGAIGNQ
jgi:hypothetical protein